jgi:Na+/proline symporter
MDLPWVPVSANVGGVQQPIPVYSDAEQDSGDEGLQTDVDSPMPSLLLAALLAAVLAAILATCSGRMQHASNSGTQLCKRP